MNILITSIGSAPSIGLVKVLRKCRDNIKIVGTDINPFGHTAGSILVDTFYEVPYAVDDGFVPFLQRIVEREHIDMLVPVNDVEVKILARHRQYFSRQVMMIPEYQTLLDVEDKFVCTEMVRELGIPCPEILTQDVYGIPRIIREKVSVGSRGIVVLKPCEVRKADPKSQFMQRLILGEEYTVDILSDWEGKPMYIVPRKREEIKAGVATKVYIERNEMLVGYVRKILNRFKLPGFSNIQFIKDDCDGTFYFIEINPRFGGCSISSVLAAENMALAFLEIARGRNFTTTFEENMNTVLWNTRVTRYFEEVVCHG